MIEKIKQYAQYVVDFLVVILAALLFRKSKQQDATEEQLVTAKTDTEIKLNDQAREAAKVNADDLVSEYDKLRDGK